MRADSQCPETNALDAWGPNAHGVHTPPLRFASADAQHLLAVEPQLEALGRRAQEGAETIACLERRPLADRHERELVKRCRGWMYVKIADAPEPRRHEGRRRRVPLRPREEYGEAREGGVDVVRDAHLVQPDRRALNLGSWPRSRAHRSSASYFFPGHSSSSLCDRPPSISPASPCTSARRGPPPSPTSTPPSRRGRRGADGDARARKVGARRERDGSEERRRVGEHLRRRDLAAGAGAAAARCVSLPRVVNPGAARRDLRARSTPAAGEAAADLPRSVSASCRSRAASLSCPQQRAAP